MESSAADRMLKEEESHKSHRFLSDLIENSGALICIKDRAGRYEQVNHKWEEVTGLTRQNTIGRTDEELFPGPAARQFRQNDLEVMESGSVLEKEEILENEHGKRFFISIKFPLRDDTGAVKGICGMITEITARKQAESQREIALAELGKSDSLIRAIADSAQDAILMMDPAGCISFWNPAAEYIFGYTNQEALGRNLHHLLAPERFLELYHEAFGRFKTTGQGAVTDKTIELQARRKDGEEFPIELSLSALQIEDDWHALGIIRDITARKHAEKALRESEALYRTFINATSDIVFLKDEKLRNIVINQSFSAYMGKTEEEIIGKDDFELMPPAAAEKCRQTDLEALARMSTITSVEIVGDQVYETLKFPVELGNNRKGIGGFIRNVSARKQAEEALQENEKRFRLITDNVRDTVWLMDMNLQTVWISPSVERKRGFTLEELRSLSLEQHMTPESLRMALELIEKNLSPERLANPQEDISVTAELEFYHKDGSTLWADTVITLLRDGQGIPTGFLGVSRDTTERRQMEEALRESERKYRLLTEKMTDIVWIADMNLRTLYVSPSIQTVLGFSQEERMHQTIDQQLTPPSLSSALEALAEELAREEQGHGDPNRNVSLVLENYHKDGSTRWMETIITGIRNSQGVLTELHGVSKDITIRMQVEQELHESRRRLENIIEFLPDSTLVVDHEGKVIAWNRAIEAMTGVRKEDMLGKGNYEYALPFYGKRRPILIDLALRPDREMEKQYTDVQRIGDILLGEAYTPNLPPGDVHLSGTSSVLYDSKGDIIAAIECIRDNTERKKLAERLSRAEKMEAVGTLAGGVAHDLNNVLGVLVGFSELLVEKLPQDSSLQKYADNILQSSIRGAAIIQDLLTLARRGVNVSEVVNLNKIVSDYLRTPELEKLKFYHPGLKISTVLEDGLLNVKGSPIHLGKTIMNLVSNAAESLSVQGEVTIRTENRYLDQPIKGYDEMKEGDYVVLTVSDTGTGISANDLGKIFEPFYTKKVMGKSGTGLGLAVVWGTVKDHNGYIDVQSEENKGTTFNLYFPVTREEMGKAEKAISPDSYMSNGESILIVDDVKEQRDLAISMLGRLGYQVEAVAGGEEAIEYLKNKKADLVVLDMIMEPGIDGLETYRRILKINPGQMAIIVSGFSETARIRKTQEMGAGDFVRKPYVMEKIGLAVRKELDRK